MHLIHTRYIQKYSTDTGQILQFISVCIVCICMYLYVSCMYHVCIIFQNMHSMKWIQADKVMICKFMYLCISYTSGYALHVSVCIWQCTSVCTLCISVCIVCIITISDCICMYWSALKHVGGHWHMNAVTDLFQTSKQVWKTHRFETSQRLVFYCFNAPPPGSRSAISWPMNWCSTAGCPTPAALQGRTFPWESGYRCNGTCFGEWCPNPQQEEGANGRGCGRAEQCIPLDLEQAYTGSWSQYVRYWATTPYPLWGSSRTWSR